MSREKALRAAVVVGIPVRLADGEPWTIPPRPLLGPIADAILRALGAADDATIEAMTARARIGERLTAFATEHTPRKATPAERDTLGVDLIPRESTPEERAALDAEIVAFQKAAETSGLAAARANLEAIHTAMGRNYPALTLDECASLLTVAHIAPCLSIVRGERQLTDLFPSEDKKTNPIRPS